MDKSENITLDQAVTAVERLLQEIKKSKKEDIVEKLNTQFKMYRHRSGKDHLLTVLIEAMDEIKNLRLTILCYRQKDETDE